MKGIAEGTYKNKHAEAAKLYIYTITYTYTYAHIHTGTWRGLAKIVVETEVVIEEQILHILRRVVAAPSPGAIIAEKTAALERECSCRARARMLLAVSDTVFGWGSRPLVSFAQYLAGRLERPAVLPCVAQTGMVSPVGGDQAPRYHPWGLL